ncbi:MAG TPA: prepilin peptidase [Solirubrobacteraceae bacterium]|jgi:leader peptidase (prepilin peptidase)/N-methyltransferase|nr:prepilin peptidase [Solirubrobacteraceae bacterium]
MIAAALFAGLIGLVTGSFLNVVAYRVPRGESLMSPGSRCPGCGHPVRPYDNVPVLSWLVLRGRCRDCGIAISTRYPIVEATTAVLFAAVVVARFPHATPIALGLVLVAFLVPLTLIDVDLRLLPDRLVAPAAALAVVAGTALDPGGEVERLLAGAAAGGCFLLIALAYPAGMGLGDVKLTGMLGLFLGAEVAVAVFAALLSGVTVGLAIIARKGMVEGRKTAIPFGPFLAAGGVVAILVGPAILHAYLHGR